MYRGTIYHSDGSLEYAQVTTHFLHIWNVELLLKFFYWCFYQHKLFSFVYFGSLVRDRHYGINWTYCAFLVWTSDMHSTTWYTAVNMKTYFQQVFVVYLFVSWLVRTILGQLSQQRSTNLQYGSPWWLEVQGHISGMAMYEAVL